MIVAVLNVVGICNGGGGILAKYKTVVVVVVIVVVLVVPIKPQYAIALPDILAPTFDVTRSLIVQHSCTTS